MSTKKDYNFSYKKAGIDVKKADMLINKAKPIINATKTTQVVGELGGFGGLFKINPKEYDNP